jgi:hypothetical protein
LPSNQLRAFSGSQVGLSNGQAPSDRPPTTTSDEDEEPIDTPDIRTRRRRPALIGELVGMVTLPAAVTGVGAIAGARDNPAYATPRPVNATGDADIGESSDGKPADHVDAFGAFEVCMADQLGDLWTVPDVEVDIDEAELDEAELDEMFDGGRDVELTDGEWMELDAAWHAAEEACADLLPEAAKVEIEAWDAFRNVELSSNQCTRAIAHPPPTALGRQIPFANHLQHDTAGLTPPHRELGRATPEPPPTRPTQRCPSSVRSARPPPP